MTTYNVEVTRFYIETKKLNKKGKPVLIPITVRKMHLYGKFYDGATAYRVVRTEKKGKLSYSLSSIVPFHEKWNTLKLAAMKAPEWKRKESMAEERFVGWLTAILGADTAKVAFTRLLTEEPARTAA